jgi:type IV pilus assembly protein PilA
LKASISADMAATNQDLERTVSSWNAQAAGTGANSKYVNSVLGLGAVNARTGVIQVTYNAPTVGLATTQNLLEFHPMIRDGAAGSSRTLLNAIAAGVSGIIDYACVTSSNLTASANFPGAQGGVPPAITNGVLAKYAPAQCR